MIGHHDRSTGVALPFVGTVRPPVRRARHAQSCLLAMVASSCVGYEPSPLLPEAELAALRSATIEGLRIEHAEPGVAADPDRATFDPADGLDEGELIGVALTLNPALRAKRLEIGEAQALLVAAGLWPNPDLGAFVRQGISGAPSTGFGVDLLFGLLRPDERPAKREVAEASIESTRAEIAALEYRVASDVRRARVAVLAADQVARQMEQESSLRDEVVGFVQRQREMGDATDLAVISVELDRVGVQRQLRDARAAYERERRELNRLLGLPAPYELRLTGLGQPLVFSLHDDIADREVERRIVAGRFDLRAMAAAYRKAEAQLRLAIARQFPRIALGPSYEKDVEGNQGLGLGASVELPLFDRNQGEIQSRQAARERSRAEYTATLHALLAQAFEARAALRRAKDEVEQQQRDVLPLIERTEALFDGALRAKGVTIFEWVTARNRSLQARRDLLDALLRHAAAVVEFEAAMGSRATPSPKEDNVNKNQEVPR